MLLDWLVEAHNLKVVIQVFGTILTYSIVVWMPQFGK